MDDQDQTIETLEDEITAMSDTHTNVVGLVQKMASTQVALSDAGFESFSEDVGEAFAALSMAADSLQETVHDAEIERNRIRNEH